LCDATAIFAGQTLLQIGGAFVKSSQDMAAYNKKIAAANAQAEAVNKSTVFKYSLSGLQQQQIEDQATVREGQARTKLNAATGEAAAAAGSGGVTGNSVRQLFRSYAAATGNDIMNIEADKDSQINQAQQTKRADQMSSQNQLLAIKLGLPDDPTMGIIGNFIGAALGVGKSFMDNTTPITDKSQRTGGIFGNGGILGTGRAWG
jgi:hypothetical protein